MLLPSFPALEVRRVQRDASEVTSRWLPKENPQVQFKLVLAGDGRTEKLYIREASSDW